MHPLTRLAFSSRVAKRAQYEAFAFTLQSDGVTVRNESHAEPAEHEYHVEIDDGVPIRCTCPADTRFEGACKHRVAIAIRRPLIDAIERADAQPIAADGGRIQTTSSNQQPAESTSETDEPCDDCLESFPCWECVRTGKQPLPE